MEIYISILTVCVAILAIIVAIVAIMFGYNLTVFRKNIDKRIDTLNKTYANELLVFKESINKKISESLINSEKLIDIQKGIDLYITEELPEDNIMRYKDNLLRLVESVKLCAEIGDPHISSSVLNDLARILITSVDDKLIKQAESYPVLDYDNILYNAIDKNVEIVEKAGLQNKLMNKSGDYSIIKEYARFFFNIYFKKFPKMR